MKFLFILILLISLLIRIPFLTREFALEEAFHARAAKTVAETGYPLVYYGEQQPRTIYLDRPPGLLLLVAASFKFFGESEISARIVPMLFFIFTLITVFYFAKKLFPNQKTAILLTLFFLSIHPYMIQNSLMIHFDGALVLFFTTLYLFLTLEKITKKQNSWRDHFLLASVLFFALWIKYEPIMLTIIISVGFAVYQFRSFLKKYLISTFICTSIYFLSFYLYNSAFGNPEGFWLPFKRIAQLSTVTFLPKIITIGWLNHVLSTWSGSFYTGIRFLSWLGVPTILLLIYSLIRFLQLKKVHSNPQVIFLVLWANLIILTYIFVGWAGDYPRYFAPAMPPLFLITGLIVSHDFDKFKNLITIKAFVALIILLTAIAFLLSNNNLLFLDRITGWVPSLQTPFFILILFGSLIIFWVTLKNHQLQFLILSTLLILNLYQVLTQYHHDLQNNYSLTNFYGNGPYKYSAKFLKEKISRESSILTFDPVGYYWDGKYYDYYQMGYHQPQNFDVIQKALEENKISAVALPELFIGDFDLNRQQKGFEFREYLQKKFKNHRNLGGQNGIEIWY